jgi:hypothetical protein
VPLLRAAFFLYLPTRVSISRSHRGHVCGAAHSQPRKTRDALGPWKIHISLLGHVMQLNRHQPARHYARFFVPADWIFAPCARTRQAIIPATAAQEPQLHYRAIFFCSRLRRSFRSGKSTHTALVGESYADDANWFVGHWPIANFVCARTTKNASRRKVPIAVRMTFVAKYSEQRIPNTGVFEIERSADRKLFVNK